MNDHNKRVSGVEATANPAPSKGRRRLIKVAALSAPAIITLRSGQAFASIIKTTDDCITETQDIFEQAKEFNTESQKYELLSDANGQPVMVKVGETPIYSAACWLSVTGQPLGG